MYRLRVIHEGSSVPTETIRLQSAADVLTAIPDLLGKYADCLRIEVLADAAVLFAVDCKGNRIGG
jgi:hypothetical protein